MPAFSDNQLRDCVSPHLPQISKPFAFTPISTGKFNTSFFLDADDTQYVLRIAPPEDSVFLFYERKMMMQEPAIHAELLEKTGVPVPRILAFDTTHEVIDRDYLVMTRLPGVPMSDASRYDSGAILFQVGQHLAAAHALTRDHYGYLGEHQPMDPQGRWIDAFRIMWTRLIDDIVLTGHFSGEEQNFMLGLLDRHLHCFDRLVPASLLHMDVWAQNILVDDKSHVTGLLDWDRALWGDPEIEYAVLDYCGISGPTFWEGYGKERDRSPEAQVRQIFYFLYELLKYIVIRHGRSKDPGAARQYKAQAMQIVSQLQGT